MNRFANMLLVLAALSFIGQTSIALAQATGDEGAAPAATGPDTTTQVIENPPLSGLDEPSFEPGYGPRSYLLPSVQINQAVDTNATGAVGSNTTIRDVTRVIGSVTLQEMWKLHPLDIAYSGGAARYYGPGAKTYQIHSLAATQRFLWRTGQFALRDSFSYLPQGSFGFGSFGGASAISGGGSVAGGGGPGITQFGSVGNQPRVTNSSVADITQALSPRASVVLSGGFALTDFVNAPAGYINSQQTSGQAGYNYQLSKHDQIAFTYGYQELHFPRTGSGTFNVNVWQVMYGHRISGKLDLKFGGGPQWIHTNGFALNQSGALVPSHRSIISGSGQASLMYHMSARSNLNLTYSHYTSPGSGFFAGANTDAVRFALSHTLTRRWSSTLDTGYSRNSRILANIPGPTSSTSLTNNASTYQYWYAGAGLRRQLGRHFGAFTSYQYDSIRFNSGFCTTGNNCNTYGRHVGLIGLDWTPHPIRLD
jgi:hypothetical protein